MGEDIRGDTSAAAVATMPTTTEQVRYLPESKDVIAPPDEGHRWEGRRWMRLPLGKETGEDEIELSATRMDWHVCWSVEKLCFQ